MFGTTSFLRASHVELWLMESNAFMKSSLFIHPVRRYVS